MYTIESLAAKNSLYHAIHKVSQGDAAMINKQIDFIEGSRTNHEPQVGDIVEITTEHGDYYANGNLVKLSFDKSTWTICEIPSAAMIYLSETGEIKCFTDGGAFYDIPNNLKYIGKRKKSFMDWGHNGACANGLVLFEAVVNVWEYKHPNPLYDSYTTKEYDRYYISYSADDKGNQKDGSKYRYFGNGIAFVNKVEYEAWRDTFKGVEFAGNWPNQTVVFTYKRIEKYVTVDDYNSLALPEDTRVCNGIILVKVEYDDNKRTITEYRYTNCGDALRGVKPYVLARSK